MQTICELVIRTYLFVRVMGIPAINRLKCCSRGKRHFGTRWQIFNDLFPTAVIICQESFLASIPIIPAFALVIIFLHNSHCTEAVLVLSPFQVCDPVGNSLREITRGVP